MNRPRLLTSGSATTVRPSRSTLVISLACIVVSIWISPAAGQSLRRSAVVRAVQQARPSVVNINGQKLVPADDQYGTEATKRVNGMGTGVVMDPRGYILTNYHVVQGVRRINVTTEVGGAYVARVVAHDPSTDLAIIKIPVTSPMKVIRRGSSHDILTGETVIAMGNAYGYEHTVTTGIVSAQHRNVQVNEQQSYRDLIQTDASINPGNSGGPLLNIDGEMIGINVAVRVGAQGIGFAIPVDQGMQVAARLMSAERLSGVWHGVIHEDQFVGAQPMLVVRQVQPGSPAERAGIRRGDVIRQVAGRKVDRGIDFECALIDAHVGESVNFAVEREDRPVDIQLGIVRRPVRKPYQARKEPADTDPSWDILGLRLEPVDKTQMKTMTQKFRGGVRVMEVKRNGVGEREGIRPDDILVGIHIWETISLENLLYIMEEADFGEEKNVPFYVLRNGKTLSGSFETSRLR